LSNSPGKILVLGFGNDILTDDAIGLHVVREVRERLAGFEQVDVEETSEMGLALLDFIVGYKALVLVDAIQTGNAPPGHVHEVSEESLGALHRSSPHFLGVGETLALGRQLGLEMPSRIKVLAIEVADPFTMGTEMTPPLQAALGPAVERVLECVHQLGNGSKTLP
jgi:hydrogenase maturation protease